MTTDAADTVPSATWNPTLIQCVTRALIHVGAIGEDEDPTADDINQAINLMQNWIKEQQASGLHVWTQQEGVLFLQPGQYRYLLGTGSTDHACDAFEYAQTTLFTTAAAGASSVVVTSATGFASGDNIGIALDANTMFWTTVSGAPVGSTVTLATPLPSQASAGASVWDYAVAAQVARPLDIPKGRYLIWQGLTEVPMRRLSRQEYMDRPQKTNPGLPIEFCYLPGTSTGQLFVWNAPSTTTYAMRFTWYRSIGDWLVQGATADFPQEWASALEWNLANELTVGYETPPPRAQRIAQMAAQKLAIVQGYDREAEAIRFGMEQMD